MGKVCQATVMMKARVWCGRQWHSSIYRRVPITPSWNWHAQLTIQRVARTGGL